MRASTLLLDSLRHPTLFTSPGGREAAASNMSGIYARGLHGFTPGSGARVQRSAWDAVTPPLSHSKRATVALTAVLSRIRSREEAS